MDGMWDVELTDLEATLALGQSLGCVAEEGTFVALRGDLGAGKTSFSQGVGHGLGVKQPVVSPTFILMAEYDDGRLPLLHADAYRLNPNEIRAIGFEEAVETWPGVVLIEWAEKVESLLPGDRLMLELSHNGAGRVAHVHALGPQHVALLTRWRAHFEE